MSETLGLYPNVIIGNDIKRLCFTLLDSNIHRILYISPEEYTLSGNTITFDFDRNLHKEDISSLIAARLAYRLIKKPERIIDNNLHRSIDTSDVSFNQALSKLLTITFVLDKISTLPALHYPYVEGQYYYFTNDILGVEYIKTVLLRIPYAKRIRLLSRDILHSEVLTAKELDGYDLEIIIGQDYYLSHINDFSTFQKKLKLIVYIDDIGRFDATKFIPVLNNISVSFFFKIRNKEESLLFEQHNYQAVAFPSPDVSPEMLHSILDYSISDLLQRTTTKSELFIKQAINPFFYGNILVNNDGSINSYPPNGYKIDDITQFRGVTKHLKNNRYWYIRRPDFFERCRECALVDLCPPLSNYEINIRQTFCVA